MEPFAPYSQVNAMNDQKTLEQKTDQEEPVRRTLDHAVESLFCLQNSAGYWRGELEGDSILQSEYILLKFILHEENDPKLVKIARHLRSQQREKDGAWIQYPGSQPDLSATVKAYFALKLMGDHPRQPHMQKAKELILALGGAERCNTYSKFYLAILGQMPWDAVPSVPPELILAPKWLFFHIDKISAWTRTMIMPLAIISHFQPTQNLPKNQGIRELYKDSTFLESPRVGTQDRRFFSWKNIFLAVDKFMKLWQKSKLMPFRRYSLRKIEKWIVDHTRLQFSDGLGAIFPPMVYDQIAFRCLGYSPDDPFLQEAKRQLDNLMIEEENSIRIEPCLSPVWDTGLALYALTEAGFTAKHPQIQTSCEWLLSKECRFHGDWAANIRKQVEPAGWYFEFNNAFYPDVDDTVMVSMALQQACLPYPTEALDRALQWIFAMQNKDGGWAAFDRTQNRPILEAIPFADHNAIQDPSCPDITGRVIECLGHFHFTLQHPSVSKAISFLRKCQKKDGSWFGRWGVNYIYGTWEVLYGFKNVGLSPRDPMIQRAGQWLTSIQNEDGSFGESPDSYKNGIYTPGDPTASQTAWGTMALLAVFGAHDERVKKGINWLVDSQAENGGWKETLFTGTGFPRIFYMRYHLYAHYFPIMALGRFLK